MGYMEATESLKYPFLTTRDTRPSRAILEVFKFSPNRSGFEVEDTRRDRKACVEATQSAVAGCQGQP
jgi:hypothetical protein